jgi:hypothetical protein
MKLGLEQSKYSMYSKTRKTDGRCVCINNKLIFSNDTKLSQSMKQHLQLEFQIKDLGSVKLCLGIRIKKTSKCITLDQEQYVESILIQ